MSEFFRKPGTTPFVNVAPTNYNQVTGLYATPQPPPPPPALDGWTVYDVFRRLIESARWADEAEKLAAIRLVDDLEASNALGTQAATTTMEVERT